MRAREHTYKDPHRPVQIVRHTAGSYTGEMQTTGVSGHLPGVDFEPLWIPEHPRHSGTAWVNTDNDHFGPALCGGRKESGMGRELTNLTARSQIKTAMNSGGVSRF